MDLYFLRQGGFTLVGRAKRPGARLEEARQWTPFAVELVHAEPGGNVAREDLLDELGRPEEVQGGWLRCAPSAAECAAAVARCRGAGLPPSERRRRQGDFRAALRRLEVELREYGGVQDERLVRDLRERVAGWAERAGAPHEREWAERMGRELEQALGNVQADDDEGGQDAG